MRNKGVRHLGLILNLINFGLNGVSQVSNIAPNKFCNNQTLAKTFDAYSYNRNHEFLVYIDHFLSKEKVALSMA